jgi:hypothetical protein
MCAVEVLKRGRGAIGSTALGPGIVMVGLWLGGVVGVDSMVAWPVKRWGVGVTQLGWGV